MRSQEEIDADFVKIKEAAYWMVNSGHTQVEEEKVFEATAARLMADFEVDPKIREVADTPELLILLLETRCRP